MKGHALGANNKHFCNKVGADQLRCSSQSQDGYRFPMRSKDMLANTFLEDKKKHTNTTETLL